MKVTIFLDGDSYVCLLKHVGRQALSRTVIDATVQLGNTRVVDCDDVEARDLLGKARSECPGAVRRITEAMLRAGLTVRRGSSEASRLKSGAGIFGAPR